MKAARNFTHGKGEEVHRYVAGEEVSEEVVKTLGDQANSLIVELAARHNPDVLSRAQLLELANLAPEDDASEAIPDEFNEETFREGMMAFTTKGDLVEWAESVLGIEGLDASWTRPQIEDSIVDAYTTEEAPEE